MSGYGVQLTFGVVVADSDRWTPEERAAAEACLDCRDYLAHAAHQVRAAMEEAGNAVIAAHPGMFRTELV